MNLFFTGDFDAGTVIGRAFLEGIEPRPENVLISQLRTSHGEVRTSSVSVRGIDIFAMVERYYAQSEQRLARFLHLESRAVLILGLPHADVRWIRSLQPEAAFRLPRRRSVKLLARRRILLRCGCDREKIAGVLVGVYGPAPEALFSQDSSVEVDCPRCGARLTVTRTDYERAWRDGSNLG
jgi:molecular chaperone Hsp33